MATQRRRVQGVDYERAGAEYLEQRQLKAGAAGWVLLAGLGVAYVISGDFAGWNFGLAEGGWGGLLIATILMAIMYTAMVFGLAELSRSEEHTSELQSRQYLVCRLLLEKKKK